MTEILSHSKTHTRYSWLRQNDQDRYSKPIGAIGIAIGSLFSEKSKVVFYAFFEIGSRPIFEFLDYERMNI